MRYSYKLQEIIEFICVNAKVQVYLPSVCKKCTAAKLFIARMVILLPTANKLLASCIAFLNFVDHVRTTINSSMVTAAKLIRIEL